MDPSSTDHARPPSAPNSSTSITVRAYVWTVIQYVLLIVLLFGGRSPFPSFASPMSLVGWGLLTVAGALTLWALRAFRATRLHVMPMVRKGGSLVVSGPYRWVRHPMYSSVLLLTAGLCLLDPSWVRIVAAVAMAPVLIAKLTVEEQLLQQAYPEYGSHMRKTARLIPGVW